MKLPAGWPADAAVRLAQRGCGPLLEFDRLRRQLNLGAPVFEGVASVEVAHIVGTVDRVHDFDGCFRPLNNSLAKRIRDIQQADPRTLDEPIDVVRLDRAYFVADGHKRVAIARQTGREFIDARVRRVPSPYAVTPPVDEASIERTIREAEFRRHSGLAEALPEVRFALTDVGSYGELFRALQAFGYDMARQLGRLPSSGEVAAAWYDCQFQPLVAMGRERVGKLIDATDADIFLTIYRHSHLHWGTDCDLAECIAAARELRERHVESDGSPLRRVLGRVARRDPTPSLLPLRTDSSSQDDH